MAGDAANLVADDAAFDAVTCIQVLLYITDVDRVLAEMHRVLKPGGRIVVMETDWRSVVLNSTNPALTEKMMTAWDQSVPNPNLPARLGPLLRRHGFTAAHVHAIPILSTSYVEKGFSVGMMTQFARLARKSGTVSEAESRDWLDELKYLGAEGAYFFCVNRFLFSAMKQ